MYVNGKIVDYEHLKLFISCYINNIIIAEKKKCDIIKFNAYSL